LLGGREGATFAGGGAQKVAGGVGCSQGDVRWPKGAKIVATAAAPAAGRNDRTIDCSRVATGCC